jgi:diguanylate cyclase (GGDEF)-like protein
MSPHTTTPQALSPEGILSAQQQVLDLVAGGAPIRDTLDAIARFSEAYIPTMMASMLIFDPETQTLRRGGAGCLPSSFCEAVDGLVPGPATGSCGTAAFRRERVISHDVQVDPLWGAFRDFAAHYGIRSAWSSPILAADGRLLGVFGMYYGDCRSPSAADLAVVDHFVHLASIAIERHRVDRDREHQATHDALTGLGNRRMLEAAVARWTTDPGASPLAIALLDLDRFKLHNENLGHRLADVLLRHAASRIKDCCGSGDLVVRFGGNQFLIVSPNGAVQKHLSCIMGSFQRPFDVGDARVRLSISAGTVEWDPRTTSFDDALYQAEQACMSAKARGRERWVDFGADERRAADERRRVSRLLADAIAERRVQPFMQPIVDLATERTIGFEMLARLVGGEAEAIPPSVFIPIAEEGAMIDALGLSMLRSTCAILAGPDTRLAGLTANVNVSLRQLMREGFSRVAIDVVGEHRIAPSRICFEVTESHWLDTDSPARDSLLELKAAGFRLALDDFGTGYASLRQLQRIPFDTVKIDRDFVSRLGDGGRGTALCEATLRMAAACGMPVTAEGVETAEQAQMLRAMGCRNAQGYLWSRPRPAADALRWLDARALELVG